MKSPIFIVAFVFTVISFIGCKQTEKEEITQKEMVTKEKVAINPDELATASFTIEGMSCEVGCSAMLEKKLAKMDGVQEAKIDFEKKLATVTYDKTQQLPANFKEKVESAVDGKTYKVLDLK